MKHRLLLVIALAVAPVAATALPSSPAAASARPAYTGPYCDNPDSGYHCEILWYSDATKTTLVGYEKMSCIGVYSSWGTTSEYYTYRTKPC